MPPALAELQTAAPRHPSRFCVAHPFNPPYLIPLVELVGSPQTDPAVISWAFDFYKSCEKFPMRCSRCDFLRIFFVFSSVDFYPPPLTVTETNFGLILV